jgi:hypothetical protein
MALVYLLEHNRLALGLAHRHRRRRIHHHHLLLLLGLLLLGLLLLTARVRLLCVAGIGITVACGRLSVFLVDRSMTF